jgi:hypothetical protein
LVNFESTRRFASMSPRVVNCAFLAAKYSAPEVGDQAPYPPAPFPRFRGKGEQERLEGLSSLSPEIGGKGWG